MATLTSSILDTDTLMQKLCGMLTRSPEQSGAGFSSARVADGRTNALMVDGVRVEVRMCRADARGRWNINIHRHKKVDERGVDAYIFVLMGIPGGGPSPVYVIARAPLKCPTIQFSFRSLTTKYREMVGNWAILHEVCRRKGKGSK